MPYYHEPSGQIAAVLPAEGTDLVSGGAVAPLHPMRTEEMARCGWFHLVELPDLPPGPPRLVDGCYAVRLSLASRQREAVERFLAAAAECLRRDLPAPWDVLREVATPEFREWAAGYMELVAAELARLEAAVSAAGSEAALAAIVADWPEVVA